ncbi:PAS domain S-box protein [Flavobacterium sp. K5-23]|uniref:PAS domain S-box protein n=1 Tax=Flavobacterium sp. K5-23 TaxID=2746225 RepID=UPI0020108223|nr:PAS domain S-box protein [Flavobacterium sp. K5-23]UQD56511.1 PAS domain S-box protein [Flavobacterium sp. K5-23]
MNKPPVPLNEFDRLKALDSFSIMDSLPEKEYDSITQLASYICETPIALVSLLDENRQWFKSSVGLGAKETSRDISFCQYTIMGDEIFEVNNALENEIFVKNPLVTGNPNIRFYAGAPLNDSNGFNLGSLCVIDTESRTLSEEQKKALKILADQVVSLLQLRKKNTALINTQKEFQSFIELSKDLVCIANVDGLFLKVNPAFETVLGYDKKELEGNPFIGFVHNDDLEKTYKEVEKLSKGHKTISFENRYRCKNGKYVQLSWNTSPDPETGNLYCIARDITFEKQQQNELLDITTDLTAILNSTDFSIIATDLDGTIKQFNKGAEVLLGYKADELIGKTSPAILHKIDEVVKRSEELTIELGEKVEPGFDVFVIKARKSYVSETYEWTYVRKDGSTFPVLLSVTAIKNQLGEITGYLGIAKDISKEKEFELNLINSKKLIEESQRIAKIGSWKFDLITKNLIWSDGHYRIFELEQTPTEKLNEAYRSRIHPDDLIALDELSDKVMQTGDDFKIKYRVVFPDKRIKHIIEIGQPFRNEFNEVIGIQGTVQDITLITLAEQKIEANIREIEHIKAALDESAIVAVTNQKGIITYVNDKFCDISKYSSEELIGNDHRIVNSGYHSKAFIKNIWVTISNGEIWKGEIKNKAKDGSFYWVNTTIVPFIDENGKPYQYIAIRNNITEQKEAQKNLKVALLNLEKNNKELDQFAYVVSHDLKAPLRAINNLAEWIVEDMPEMPEEVKYNLGLLRGRILRMENLINGVLDYSRIGRTKIKKESTDLKVMLDQIVETIVPNKEFEVSIDENMPTIMGPKILLNQVFSNIISNSVKYNDKPIGIISCKYKELPDFHQFTLTDNGPGIPNEYHKKVFQVFQTIEARDVKESTGIGLSIVKKIIEEQGGEIFIESEENINTSFIFTLPK